MGEDASLRFPDAPLVATSDVEVQRLRAAVAAKLTGAEAVPVRVGRFVILERVGEGAMGVVYAAYDAELDRKVAIKILQPTGDDRALRQRLVREAQAMARLSHPNVVGVFEIGEHDGHGFVAMEFVRGTTLRQWLTAAKRSPGAILAAYLQAGRGLAAAHVAGIVHRDFKPDNVLVDTELDAQGAPRVRVVDFGLAHTGALSEAGISLTSGVGPSDVLVTRAGVRVGTPGYMAPEQILGEPTEARTDQFAFCIALWEALAGERPFAGKSASDVFERVLQAKIRSPPRGTIAPWVEAALRVGLAERPDDRHAGMDVLLARLADDPRRRRRRRLAIALGVSVIPVGVIVWRTALAMAHARCTDAGAQIDSVWTPEAASAVASSFENSGAANADTMSGRVHPRLDEYAERWRSASIDVCTATTIDRTLDSEAMERAASCLGEARGALETAIETLSHADTIVVENSVFTVLQLPLPERCTDARELALEPPLPDDLDTRAELRRIQAAQAQADILRWLGRNEEALALLDAEADAIAALGLPVLQARSLYHRAQLQQNLDAPDQARATAEQAFFTAYRAGDDLTAANAAILLSQYFGVMRNDEAASVHWDQLASSALARTPLDGRDAEMSRAITVARRAMIRGDPDEGMRVLEPAIAAIEELYGSEHLGVAEAVLTLAELRSRLDDAEGSRADYERVYAIISAALGEDHPWTARALAGLGLALHGLGANAEALDRIERALAIDEQLYGTENINVGVDLSYASLVLQATGRGADAAACIERALPLFRATFGDEHHEVIILLGNLGRARQTAGDLEGARTALEQALAMHARIGSTDAETLEENQTSLAQVLRAQQEPT